MRRFYLDTDKRSHNEVILDSAESRHIGRVLRLKKGDSIELFDGLGKIYSAEIIEDAPHIKVRIQTERYADEKPSGVHVGQALIKGKNLEMLLQKCTELGVESFLPFTGKRSQGNLQRQFAGKEERWQKIIEESCKQSMRVVPLKLHPISTFADVITSGGFTESQLKLLFWENEKESTLESLSQKIRLSQATHIFFGPEGGFTEEEVEKAIDAGWQTVSLGKNILRSETAVIAATAIVQHYRGNM